MPTNNITVDWAEIYPAGSGVFDWTGAASSADGKVLYACIYGGPIYRSTDGGATWVQIRGVGNWVGLTCDASGCVVLVLERGGRVWLSDASGIWWDEECPLGDTDAWWMDGAVSEDGSRVVVCADEAGVYLRDMQGTWCQIAPATGWNTLAANADLTTIMAADSWGRCVHVTRNGGKTWQTLDLPSGWYSALSCSRNGHVMVAGAYAQDSSGAGYIYLSRNGGRKWERIDLPMQCWNIAVVSGDGKRLLIGSYLTRDGWPVGLWLSDDSGKTWQPLPNPLPGWEKWTTAACDSDLVLQCLLPVHRYAIYLGKFVVPEKVGWWRRFLSAVGL